MQHVGTFLTLTGLILGSVVSTQLGQAQNRSGAAPVKANVTTGLGTSLTQPSSVGEPVERGWFLTGKVMMDDGSLPPENVTIQRVCGGMNRPVAYTDSRGRFSFQLGQKSADVIPDASVDAGEEGRVALMAPIGETTHNGRLFGSPGSGQMNGCALEASLPGYHSDVLELGGRKYMDNPDVGTIVLHRLGNVEGTSISATSFEAPRDAKKAFEKGLDAGKKQKWPEAQAQFEKAVAQYPKYAAAWFELGTALQRQGNRVKAREAFQKSVKADNKFLKPYFPLSAMAFEEKNWTETVSLTSTLTKLDPVDYPLAFLFNAIANISLGKLDDAEKSAREAVRLDTRHQVPRAEYVLGLILADKHDYDESLALLKSYIERAPNTPDSANIKKQISQIENMARAQQPAASAQ